MENAEYIVNTNGDIEPVLQMIRERICERLDTEANKNICALLCEELLIHLLLNGSRDIRVAAVSGYRPYVRIDAQGEPDELFDHSREARRDDLLYSISGNILRQYDRFIEYRYVKNRNIYRISPQDDKSESLKDEILAFYDGMSEKEKRNPSGFLLWLAKKHPGMTAGGILFRTVRHFAALLLPVFASNIIQVFFDKHTFFDKSVYLNLLASCIALCVNLTVAWFENRVYQSFTRALEYSLKVAVVRKLQTLSFRYHNETPSGKLFAKLASDIQFIKLLLYDYSTSIIFMVEDLLFTAVISCLRMPVMLVVYGILIPLEVFVIRSFSIPLQKSKAEVRVKTEASDSMFKEMLAKDQMLRANGLQHTETMRISRSFREVQKAAKKQDNMQLVFNSTGYGLAQGFRLIILALSVLFATMGYIEIGSVVLFLSLLDIAITSTQRTLDMAPQITQGIDSLVSVHELLSEDSTEKNGERILPHPIKGEICFKDVTFRHGEDKETVLRGINLTIPAKKTTAIIGKSGSGKTTILNLILGLYSKDSGEILIDGIDIDELDKNSYRRSLAVVLQTPVLFASTLWDNLTYGQPYCSTRQVMDVLEKVGLTDLVNNSEDGLDMRISEGGLNLSGGQRQRVSIAQALLRNPDILIFDEATSALDAESEREVQAALESVMSGCTVIIAAHRLNTIKKADVFYEICDGTAIRYDSFEQINSR
ncbi:MAG: ABC transporter ATP-binding protein [Lachnospiraceae bacterium]|nr:ABC transporter ATP-binding protein [Lachnospiraceae bacterium]